MKLFREIMGYLLGGVVFVLLVPWGMWLLSGRPELRCGLSWRIVVAWVMMAAGLPLRNEKHNLSTSAKTPSNETK